MYLIPSVVKVAIFWPRRENVHYRVAAKCSGCAVEVMLNKIVDYYILSASVAKGIRRRISKEELAT
jgi:hypothetical protein